MTRHRLRCYDLFNDDAFMVLIRHGVTPPMVLSPLPQQLDRCTNKDPTARITIVDILCWTIHETWTDLQYLAGSSVLGATTGHEP